MVLVTVTDNAGGGQPFSLANLWETSRLCRAAGVPFLLDAARFAENAWLVSRREAGQLGRPVADIAREAFDLADGCIASLEKDGIAPIGGMLCLRDDALAECCRTLLIATEGFPTYGGLSGHDLEIFTQGLTEVLDHAYLRSREETATALAKRITAGGAHVVRPPGLHAIYLDAGRLLPHLTPDQYPGHALACQLYLDGGIRSVEIGSLFHGRHDDTHRLLEPAPHELLRLALPRRVYNDGHLTHVADTVTRIAARPDTVPGYRITHALRHFTGRLTPPSPVPDRARARPNRVPSVLDACELFPVGLQQAPEPVR